MKGVILAGGKGTRLRPATYAMNKHMVPVLNKPMILYPLETLKALGCTDILIVSGGEHIGGFADFFGDGSEYGVELTYRVQKEAGGIAQALALAKDFANGDRIAVILGDNVFDNAQFDVTPEPLEPWHAHLFVKAVSDPQRFGVLSTDPENEGKYIIQEKPKQPLSDKAVTGLYIYPGDVFEVVPTLVPSARGELEITDVNNHYVKKGDCTVTNLDGFWSDAGTPKSLAEVTKWAWANEHEKYGE